MAGRSLGCCAKTQKCLIILINFALLLIGVAEIGIAVYFMVGSGEGLEFFSEVLEDNNTMVELMLVFGIALALLSFLGCCGLIMKQRCLLWVYVIVMFFLITGQAMVFAVGLISDTYYEEIFSEIWFDLSNETRMDIESAYDCCSFNNGTDENAYENDITDYEECSSRNSDSSIETCWSKFWSDVEANFKTIALTIGVTFAVQIIIYFSTHYLMQSIAKAKAKATGVVQEDEEEESSSPSPSMEMGVMLNETHEARSARIMF